MDEGSPHAAWEQAILADVARIYHADASSPDGASNSSSTHGPSSASTGDIAHLFQKVQEKIAGAEAAWPAMQQAAFFERWLNIWGVPDPLSTTASPVSMTMTMSMAPQPSINTAALAIPTSPSAQSLHGPGYLPSVLMDSIQQIRTWLVDAYEASGAWRKAARTWQAVLEHAASTGPRLDSASETRLTFGRLVRLLRLYLEAGDIPHAETSLNRATSLLPDLGDAILKSDDMQTYKIMQARLLDQKGAYLLAAQRYIDVMATSEVLDPHVKENILQQAVICAILAPPSSQKDVALAFLTQRRLPFKTLASMVHQMSSKRFIRPASLAACVSEIPPQYLTSPTDGGMSSLHQAVLDHNVQSMAHLYSTLTIRRAASLLGVSEMQTEEAIGRLWTSGQVKAVLDDVDRTIEFPQQDDREVLGQQLSSLLDQVEEACEEVRRVAPAFYEEEMAKLSLLHA